MIPATLTIKGLYSYQKETTIDFAPLVSAGLFGIFGAVGSGKSSILEAITFALYGETERLNSRDSRSYNMMNLKCNEMLIDFEFFSGAEQDKYKFTVSCRRNKKRYNETTPFERKAYRWVNDNWQPIDKTAAAVLGLSYDNFKRTIIIPQGKFQEFLQLKETERVQMLKEIFNLEKFELGPKVAVLTKENDLRISNTEGQMTTLPEYDETILQQKQKEILAEQKTFDRLTIALQQRQQEEKEYELLKLLFGDLQIKTEKYNKQKQSEQNIIDLEKEVTKYAFCQKTFGHLFDNKKKLADILLQQQEHLAKQKQKALETSASIKHDELLINNLEESYKVKETLLQKAAELEKIISIKDLATTIKQYEERIGNGQKIITGKQSEYEDVNKQTILLQQNIATKEQSLSDTSLLIELNNWFSKRAEVVNEINNYENDKGQLQIKLSEYSTIIKENLEALPKEISFSVMPESIDMVQSETRKLSASYDNELQKLNNEVSHFQLSQKLQEFATGLHEGEACPLCGALHHPQILSAKNVDEEIKTISKKVKAIANNKIKLHQILVALSAVYADYANINQSIKDKAGQLIQKQLALQIYNDTFSFKNYTIKDDALVKQQLQDVQGKTKELSTLRLQLNDRQKTLELNLKEIDKFKKGIDELSNEKAKTEGQLYILRKQIILYQLENELANEAATLQANSLQLKKSYTDIINQYEKARKSIQKNETELSELKGTIAEVEKQLSANNDELSKQISDINSLLLKNGYADESKVTTILQKNINVEDENEKIVSYRQQLHAVSMQLQEAKVKVEGKQYDEMQHAQLSSLMQNQLIQIKLQTEKVATLKSYFKNLQMQMRERKKLQSEHDKLSERSGNLKTLGSLFKAAGFVNYVSSVYLQNLINSANQRFYKMTRQHLLLELTADNAFQVRDFMNKGELRSVKTLSGGQTFQAALSLALALADNIQHLTLSTENFFFLDEGFGSLDKDALTVVFETLQALRKEKRIVGIISHVEEMQHEIEVNLKVHNDINEGSSIRKSW